MNDNSTNRPRDNTAAPGDDFPEVKSVAEAFLFLFTSHQVVTFDEIRRLIIALSQTCYLLGLEAGKSNAYRELAILQASAAKTAETPQLHIVNATTAEINEHPDTRQP